PRADRRAEHLPRAVAAAGRGGERGVHDRAGRPAERGAVPRWGSGPRRWHGGAAAHRLVGSRRGVRPPWFAGDRPRGGTQPGRDLAVAGGPRAAQRLGGVGGLERRWPGLLAGAAAVDRRAAV